MGKQYEHFSLEERCTIARLQQAGQSIRQIATALDRSPSSVCRELRRNHGSQVGYKPVYAEEQAPAQAILVAHERKSRLLLLAKQPSKAAHPAADQLMAWFQALDRRLRKTITFDNGTEFAQHYILKDELGIRTFFCDPHSPWQKGAIENAIGRMRRPLPRKTNLNTIDHHTLTAAVAAYNNTPRKCLGFKSPAQAFLSQLLHFKCESTPSLRSG